MSLREHLSSIATLFAGAASVAGVSYLARRSKSRSEAEEASLDSELARYGETATGMMHTTRKETLPLAASRLDARNVGVIDAVGKKLSLAWDASSPEWTPLQRSEVFAAVALNSETTDSILRQMIGSEYSRRVEFPSWGRGQISTGKKEGLRQKLPVSGLEVYLAHLLAAEICSSGAESARRSAADLTEETVQENFAIVLGSRPETSGLVVQDLSPVWRNTRERMRAMKGFSQYLQEQTAMHLETARDALEEIQARSDVSGFFDELDDERLKPVRYLELESDEPASDDEPS